MKGKEDMKDLVDMASQIDSVMTTVENELYQTKNRSRQDPLNFPIKLTNKLGHVASLSSRGDFAPTQQAINVKNEMVSKINDQVAKFKKVKEEDIPAFNKLFRQKSMDAILLDTDDD